MVGAVRISNGRSEKTTFLIVDAQSVKNTDTSEHKGYDAGKEISGIKRHIAVDTQGLPDAIEVTTAGVTDRKGHWKLLPITRNRCRRWSIFWPMAPIRASLLQTALLKYLEQRSKLPKRNELHTFKVMPQRWVLERSFGWLEQCRRLWKNCERQLNTSLQLVNFSCLALILY